MWIPEPNTGCFLWLGALTKGDHGRGGYGLSCHNGKQTTAHRVAWAMVNGPIPAGMLALHRCDMRSCVNPDHIFLGTAADNTADMMKKVRNYVPVRLRDCEVDEIRRLYALGVTQPYLARMFRTRQQTVSRIINYKRRRFRWN
jgi:hypothetical protein